jgi:hypothetical protein
MSSLFDVKGNLAQIISDFHFRPFHEPLFAFGYWQGLYELRCARRAEGSLKLSFSQRLECTEIGERLDGLDSAVYS